MKKVLIDTDVLIIYSHGYNEKFIELLKDQDNHKVQLYLNPIIIAEFLNDNKLRNKIQKNNIEEFIELFSMLSVNKETGIIAGKLLRENQIPFIADAFIVASCLQYKLELYSSDKKHFVGIKKLKLFTP